MNRNVRIYFTSDLHGYFFPTTYADTQTRDMGLFKCANRFKKDGNTLIVDGGDILQGSAFANYCQSEYGSSLPIAEIMNRCGYDYITVGNHDLNYGIDYLASYIDALNARCVCQNLNTASGDIPCPFHIHTLENGLRLGISGVVTDHVMVWERPENLKGVYASDPFKAAESALNEMRGQCDLTVCIYHGGFERDLETGAVLTNSTENIAWRICKELDYDILLTGHQHMSIPGRMLNGTFIVQPAENGKEFHLLDAAVDAQGHKTITSQRIAAGGECERSLYQAYQPLDARVQTWLDETVGTMEQPLLPQSRIEMAAHGSGIADFLNHIQLYFTGAQVSAVSLANDVSGFSTTVTRRNILSTYPYPNSLVVLEISRAMLCAAIERSAEYFSFENGRLLVSEKYLKPKVEHYNYDYFAGISYQIDVLRPLGERVVSLTRAGKAIKDGDLISICVNNYRSSGAGGYPMYPKGKVLRETNLDMADLIQKYFEIYPHISRADMERSKHSFQIMKGHTPL